MILGISVFTLVYFLFFGGWAWELMRAIHATFDLPQLLLELFLTFRAESSFLALNVFLFLHLSPHSHVSMERCSS